MDIQFLTTLIVVAKEQSIEAAKSLKANCTYVDNWCWIFEGDIECLEDDGVKFNELADGAVPGLGDMSRTELVDLCEEVFSVNVYNQSFNPTANSAAG